MLAPAIALARLVPHDLAPVERPSEHRTPGTRRPRVRSPELGPRRRHAFGVERLRDPRQASAGRAQLKHPADDNGLRLVDPPLPLPHGMWRAVRFVSEAVAAALLGQLLVTAGLSQSQIIAAMTCCALLIPADAIGPGRRKRIVAQFFRLRLQSPGVFTLLVFIVCGAVGVTAAWLIRQPRQTKASVAATDDGATEDRHLLADERAAMLVGLRSLPAGKVGIVSIKEPPVRARFGAEISRCVPLIWMDSRRELHARQARAVQTLRPAVDRGGLVAVDRRESGVGWRARWFCHQ
jgi:hypothetical protein